MPGVGQFQSKGTPAANGAYGYSAGASGVVAVPDKAHLVGLTAWAAAAGATCQVGAGAVVAVPIGGSFTQDVQGGIVGAVNVTFVNTSQYFVEWILP